MENCGAFKVVSRNQAHCLQMQISLKCETAELTAKPEYGLLSCMKPNPAQT